MNRPQYDKRTNKGLRPLYGVMGESLDLLREDILVASTEIGKLVIATWLRVGPIATVINPTTYYITVMSGPFPWPEVPLGAFIRNGMLRNLFVERSSRHAHHHSANRKEALAYHNDVVGYARFVLARDRRALLKVFAKRHTHLQQLENAHNMLELALFEETT